MAGFISTDSFFRQGSTHPVCQDYADHFQEAGEASAYFSDGCSTAESPHLSDSSGQGPKRVYTDFGSRLLVLAGQQLHRSSQRLADTPEGGLTYDMQDARAHTDIVRRADLYRRHLGLHQAALDATLGSILLKDSRFIIRLSGDGRFLLRYRGTNKFRVVRVEFPSGPGRPGGGGAPYYLRYSLRQEDYEAYLARFGATYHLYQFDWTAEQELPAVEPEVRTFPAWSDLGHVDAFEFPVKEFDMALGCSDGEQSFQRPGPGNVPEPVPAHLILSELVGIRAFGGNFVSRRCNRAMATFASRGWFHYDDFSMVGIYVSEAV